MKVLKGFGLMLILAGVVVTIMACVSNQKADETIARVDKLIETYDIAVSNPVREEKISEEIDSINWSYVPDSSDAEKAREEILQSADVLEEEIYGEYTAIDSYYDDTVSDIYCGEQEVEDDKGNVGDNNDFVVNDLAGSEVDIYTLAWQMYGMDEYTTTGALRLISYEGNEFDWYLNYCTACATIVNWYNKGCGDIYEAFGGADDYYRYWNFGDVPIKDSAIEVLREALISTDWRCVEVNGLCVENGYGWTGRSIDSAWYSVYYDGLWHGVWED